MPKSPSSKQDLTKFRQALSQLPDSLPKSNPSWEQMSQEQQQLLVHKAVEIILHNKPLPRQISSNLPPKLAKALAEVLHSQQGEIQVGRLRKLPQRLQHLVDRLLERGLLDKPTAGNPLDSLDPAQRQRQLAVEALQLRRQNATQMLNAQKLLQRELRM